MHGQLAGHVRGTGAVGHMGWTEGLVALWQDRIISCLPKKHSNLHFADTLGLHFAIKKTSLILARIGITADL